MVRNKKGSVQDALYIGMFVLFFGIMVLLAFMMNTRIDTQIQTMDIMPTEAKVVSGQINGFFPGVFDSMFIVLFVFLSIGAIALAAMTRVHPIFMVIFFIAWLFLLMLSAVMSNMYTEMASNSELIAYADRLPMITYGLSYLPYMVGIVGILIMIVMYKSRQSDLAF